MEKRKLGFGTMRLPLLVPDDPKSIDLEQFKRMTDRYLETGFSYFDTAYPYHGENSENAVRQALTERYPRDRYILADKMPILRVKSTSDYSTFFEEQLRRCGVDYFDYYLLHNLGRDRYVNTERFGGFRFMEDQKKKGRVRQIGFSFHDDAKTLDTILTEHPEVDFVQLQINYLDWDGEVAQSGRCYEVAVSHGKRIIVMEPVKGGILARLPDEAIKCFEEYYKGRGSRHCANLQEAGEIQDRTGDRYNTEITGSDGGADSMLRHQFDDDNRRSIAGCGGEDAAVPSPASLAVRYAASLEHVEMVLSGMSNIEQLEDNISYMQSFEPLSHEERELVDRITAILNSTLRVPCTHCGYCTEVCPEKINIPDYFGLLNLHAVTGQITKMYYQRFSMNRGKASDCIKCGLCEGNCPQHIAIRQHIEEFAGLYE